MHPDVVPVDVAAAEIVPPELVLFEPLVVDGRSVVGVYFEHVRTVTVNDECFVRRLANRTLLVAVEVPKL